MCVPPPPYAYCKVVFWGKAHRSLGMGEMLNRPSSVLRSPMMYKSAKAFQAWCSMSAFSLPLVSNQRNKYSYSSESLSNNTQYAYTSAQLASTVYVTLPIKTVYMVGM